MNTQRIHALSLIDPTWTARILLNRTDVSAILQDNLLKVTKCKPVNSTVIFTDHKVKGTCFSLLPLEIDGNLWFSLPNSEDLIRYSPEISYPFIHHLDTIIVIIIVIFCIYYAKLCLIRRASTTAATALIDLAHTLKPQSSKRKRRMGINSVLVQPSASAESGHLFVPRIYALLSSVVDKASSLPYIEIVINNTPTIALFDSGASISYMRHSSTKALNCTNSVTTTKTPPARAANGGEVYLTGTINLLVQIASSSLLHRFHVSADDQCPAPVLLGSDFINNLNKHGLIVTLDLYNQKVTIGPKVYKTLQLNTISTAVPNNYKVRLLEEIILPKRSKNFIAAYVDQYKPALDVTPLLIEDNLQPSDSLFIVGRCLVSPESNGQCPLLVVNASWTTITLYKGMCIAIAFPIAMMQQQVATLNTVIPHPYTPPEADWEAEVPKFPNVINHQYSPANDVDLSSADLSESDKMRLKAIIDAHRNAFVGPDGHLGHYNGPIRHRIDIQDGAHIPARKIYRIPLEKRLEIERQIMQMLQDGIIRESTSPFGVLIVLVKKRDANSWRFTIDFRELNAITKPHQSILPNNQDIIDLCANKCLYSSLDFQQGFHQIPVEESHCERTAFACFLGSFEYFRMPMGLKGAPATFQRIMDDLKKRLRAQVFIYIDDLIITSETSEEHLTDIDEVLGKIEQSMKLKAFKCGFARKEIRFLGYVLSNDGIRPNPDKTETIDAYPTPTTVTEVKAFLGMCSFFRRFVHDFARIAAPLSNLLKKDTPFEWTAECDHSMRTLKNALTTPLY
ncbi:unnamed protein product [Heligmosomoides polygyrus]|uniref:RNA-directed DNA polymerase n=1 Tax=Heligmosomoides polygyrus TaxID=6339 RepID=A0A3P8DS70_HELPZ|nr:unnamed protein product [Heligmosomoides polygyrus]